MSKQTTFDKVKLLGIEIDALTNVEAIDYIATRATPGQPAGYITKPYVEFLDQTRRRPHLRSLINDADLTIADGVALVWAAHFLYAGPRNLWRFMLSLSQIVLSPRSLLWPLPDRAAGINLTWPLLERAAREHLKVYLIGSPKHGSIQHTVRTLSQKIPTLTIVGSHDGLDPTASRGHVSDDWLQTTTATVRAAAPDLILVGMGFPLQETVCAHLAAHLDHGIAIGEGGTFDYELFGGTQPKAPAAFQRLGLEWLWRLAREPRRLVRQLAIPRFIWSIWRDR